MRSWLPLESNLEAAFADFPSMFLPTAILALWMENKDKPKIWINMFLKESKTEILYSAFIRLKRISIVVQYSSNCTSKVKDAESQKQQLKEVLFPIKFIFHRK